MLANSIIYSLLIGLIPSLIWLFFWLKEDTHAEPRGMIISTFIAGIITVIFAALIEKLIATNVTDPSLLYTLWAGTEEILKFIAVAVIILNTKTYDEPVDAMIYSITLALGFAAAENILFIMGTMSQGSVIQGLITGNLRFIGATLVHTVSTAFIGFTIGYVFYHGKFAKLVATIIGLAGAIAIHSAFNLSIITGSTDDTLKAFGWIWGAVVVLIVLFEEIKAVKPKYW